MPQLHSVKSTQGRNTRRIGRGGKRGTYSGRGMKGQRSRSGHSIRPAIRDLIKRFPTLRGDSASDVPDTAVTTITLEQLAKKFSGGESITPKTLEKSGLLINKTDAAKIVGNQNAPKKVNVVGVPTSAAAKTAIEQAGGTVK